MAKRKPNSKPKRDIYQEITDRIIEHLESGQLPPWTQPIKNAGGDPFPKNLATGKPYRGINIWWLSLIGASAGFESRHWLTFKQAKAMGGMVRKGEHGSPVTFWKTYEKEDKETGKKSVLPVLKHYTVFNLDQIDGVDATDVVQVDPADFELIAEAEKILKGWAGCPVVEHRGVGASYFPKSDKIIIAAPERFEPREGYYACLFHEAIHATGHKSRLDRLGEETPSPFGSREYSKEELVAEMGSAFLCAVAGISPMTIEQSAAYIKGWIVKLRSDKRLVVQAAGKAQKAADLVLGIRFEDEAEALPVNKAPRHQLG